MKMKSYNWSVNSKEYLLVSPCNLLQSLCTLTTMALGWGVSGWVEVKVTVAFTWTFRSLTRTDII